MQPIKPRAPLPLRKERGWNTFDRWLRKHPRFLRLERLTRNAVLWQIVRRARGNHTTGQLLVQTAGGGTGNGEGTDYTDINDSVPVLEQQGFASGIKAGARGMVIPNIGGVVGSAACFGMRKMDHRPKVLGDWEPCMYHVAGTRVWALDSGELRLETDLADYLEDPADLDEGAKIRLKHAGVKGDLEAYGEHEVRQRAQPAGGTGASASTKLESSGSATFEVSDGAGVTGTITMDNDGTIKLENSSGASLTIAPDGTITALPADGKQVRLGGDAGLQALALANLVKAELDAIAAAFNGHVHVETGANTLVPTVGLGIPIVPNEVAAANVVAP